MLSIFKKNKVVGSTPFSEFIRNASSAQKKRVYAVVLKEATVQQQRVMIEAKRRKSEQATSQASITVA